MRATNVHPTENQKRVIAKIIASPTPSVAASEISNDVNVVGARNELMKLGIITFSNGQAALTDQGAQIAVDENITDETGQLTPTGEQLAYTDSSNRQEQQPTAENPPPPMESVSSFKEFFYRHNHSRW